MCYVEIIKCIPHDYETNCKYKHSIVLTAALERSAGNNSAQT